MNLSCTQVVAFLNYVAYKYLEKAIPIWIHINCTIYKNKSALKSRVLATKCWKMPDFLKQKAQWCVQLVVGGSPGTVLVDPGKALWACCVATSIIFRSLDTCCYSQHIHIISTIEKTAFVGNVCLLFVIISRDNERSSKFDSAYIMLEWMAAKCNNGALCFA